MGSRTALMGLDRYRLRLVLALFFLALALPTAALIYRAYSQLKWETFHRHRLLAEELVTRIDGHLQQLIRAEEQRPFTDYAFLNLAGDPSANFLQRSPLSAFPVSSPIPGLIGYFQVDDQGGFSSPLLPRSGSSALGLSGQELRQREEASAHLRRILSENRLVQHGKDKAKAKEELRPNETKSAAEDEGVAMQFDAARAPQVAAEQDAGPETVPAQAAFDQLNLAFSEQQAKGQQQSRAMGRVADLKLDSRLQQQAVTGSAQPEPAPKLLEKRARKERGTLPETPAPSLAPARERAEPADQARIRAFESEIDPFDFSLLDSGHFVLFRKVWRGGQRYIQGALLEQGPFLDGSIQSAFKDTALSRMSDLVVAYRGDVVAVFSGQSARVYLGSAQELSGALLHQTRLSAPLGGLEVLLSIRQLPAGPGGLVLGWVAGVLVLVLCVGFALLYRLGLRQIELVRQQQDFVSAVSHELKTPLTSIRMYGEMLREGWAPEEKKRLYYDFIHDESERLSRLINNVLQLARMTRNEVRVELKDWPVAELMQGVRSKIEAQVERAGFVLQLDCAAGEGLCIRVDADYFTQILINLVDNALKFAAKAERKAIDIACQTQRDGTLMFSVRDYGPGVPREQMKKIFRLFYRLENELTRETVGTGIGLALVRQLAQAMGGRVDVIGRDPGIEFRICFARSVIP